MVTPKKMLLFMLNLRLLDTKWRPIIVALFIYTLSRRLERTNMVEFVFIKATIWREKYEFEEIKSSCDMTHCLFELRV